MESILIVLGITLVIVVRGGLWLYAGRWRGQVSDEISAHQSTSVGDLPSSEDEDADEDEGGAGVAKPAATLEPPESIPGRMQRLRTHLVGVGGSGKAALPVLSRGDLTEEDWEGIEDTLFTFDLGIEMTTFLTDEPRTQAKVLRTSDPEAACTVLRAELLKLVDPSLDRSLNLECPIPVEDAQGKPVAAILMMGINGTGKTTTCGKLARVLVAQDRTVVLGTADIFRAAAVEQLSTQGERVGIDIVRSGKEGVDLASVAYDAVCEAVAQEADAVVVDTAGRLQDKADLMDELGKIRQVMEKTAPVGEILLVLDAIAGQNDTRQVQVFSEVVDVIGIVLTKLDGTTKDGIAVIVQKELGVSVKLVGLGEGVDDLAPFDPEGSVGALLG